MSQFALWRVASASGLGDGTEWEQLLCSVWLCVLKALLASGTTVISVGHRPTLVRYHKQVLQLASNQGGVPGKWKVLPAEQMMASANELV